LGEKIAKFSINKNSRKKIPAQGPGLVLIFLKMTKKKSMGLKENGFTLSSALQCISNSPILSKIIQE